MKPRHSTQTDLGTNALLATPKSNHGPNEYQAHLGVSAAALALLVSACVITACSRGMVFGQHWAPVTTVAEPAPNKKKQVKTTAAAPRLKKMAVVETPKKKAIVRVKVAATAKKKPPIRKTMPVEARIATSAAPITPAVVAIHTASVSASGQAQPNTPAMEKVEALARKLATDLSRDCPLAAPEDQQALNDCRKLLFGPSSLRASLSDITVWGRQNLQKPDALLKDTNLTTFGQDALTSMYVPLFMFSGQYEVKYIEQEKLFRIELGASFRRRLPPGQFPYPFWHNEEKWNTYQTANAIYFFVDPASMKIKVAQFTPLGVVEAKVTEPPAPRTFDGQWMWTDANGQVQPKATLFDGIFEPQNPYLAQLDGSYRTFAISLRDGTCMSCHTPNNPAKMKRLVIFQTPAHAASEIERLMAAVQHDRMPRDAETGFELPLPDDKKAVFLARAEAFARLVRLAKSWERDHDDRASLEEARP